MGGRGGVALVALAVVMAAAPAGAAPASEGQVLGVARALAYDRKLPERAGDEVRLGVVVMESSADSRRTAAAVVGALGGPDGVSIQGLPVLVQALPYESAPALGLEALDRELDVLLLAPGLGAHVGAISVTCQQLQIPCVAFDARAIEAGVSLAVEEEEGEVELYVNLPASRAQGAAFSSKLLQVAHVER